MKNPFDTARVLVQRFTDPAYRLEGENAATTDVKQAKHWIDTYNSLIEFKRQLLDSSIGFADRAPSDVGQAIRESDIILLEVQLSRFEQRRDYWTLRATELAGRRIGPD
jgi:hypothetical protein